MREFDPRSWVDDGLPPILPMSFVVKKLCRTGLISSLLICSMLLLPGQHLHAKDTAGSGTLERWTFEKGTSGWTAAHHAKLGARQGLLRIESIGNEPFLHGPQMDCQGPVLVRFQARSKSAGQGRIYWTERLPTLTTSPWGETAVSYFDIIADGQWHDYAVPIDTDGRITQLRMDPSHAPGVTEVKWIELVSPPASNGPLMFANRRMPAQLHIENSSLQLALDTKAHQFSVADRRTGRRWISAPSSEIRLLDARQTSSSTMELRLALRRSSLPLTCAVSLEENSVSFEMDMDRESKPGNLAYPPCLETSWDRGALVFCSRSCGQLIDQAEFKSYPVKSFPCFSNQGLDMPWMGLVDLSRGDGAMLLLKTPTDAKVEMKADEQGHWWPQPCWLESQDKWAYPRKVSWQFTDAGGYVALAKAYRGYARSVGPWKTLEEKAKDRPNVMKLKGAADIWGCGKKQDALQFAEEARASGLSHAIISYGATPGPEVARLNEMGFLTSAYDNYDDIRDGPLGLNSDNVKEVALLGRDGKPVQGWVTLEGLKYSVRASSHALDAAQHLIPPILKEYPFTARFIDVSPTAGLVEDYNPANLTDRRQHMENIRELLRYVASLGLVVGGEHGKFWNADLLDYAEGTMSGPFWWEMPAGHLKPPKSRDEIKADYLKYGVNPATRIPLWELVYHDCVATTWYWGDSSGFYCDVAPELNDFQDLCNMLYGTTPLLWVNNLGYGWNRHRSRFLQTCWTTCRLHEEATGFRELLSHEYLTPDRQIQRTNFSGGATVVVNFSDKPFSYRTGDGGEIVLAPYGFLARAPGFFQERVIENGQETTRIEGQDFHLLDSPVRRQAGPLAVAGRLVVYRISPDNWGCTVESGEECTIDLVALTGRQIGEHCRVFPVGDRGERGPALESAITNDIVHLPGGKGLRVFAIENIEAACQSVR